MPTIAGKPVFDVMPDFVAPPRQTVSMHMLLSGHSPAPRIAAFKGKRPAHVLPFEYVVLSQEERNAIEDHWNAMYGRGGGFWIPSWHKDLALVANWSLGATALQIEYVGYNATFLADANTYALGRWIWIRYPDGTMDYREVTAASGSATPETLTVAAMSKAGVASACAAGFMHYVRFASDALIWQAKGVNNARVKLDMVEILDVTSEADAA